MSAYADEIFNAILNLLRYPDKTQRYVEHAMSMLRAHESKLRRNAPKKLSVYNAIIANHFHEYESALEELKSVDLVDLCADTSLSTPLSAIYLYTKGVALSSLGRYSEALMTLDSIDEQNKEYYAKTLIIQCLLKLDDVDQANYYLSSLLNDYESNPNEIPNPLTDIVITLEFARYYAKYYAEYAKYTDRDLPFEWIRITLLHHSNNPLALDTYAEISALLKRSKELEAARQQLTYCQLYHNVSLHLATYHASYDGNMEKAQYHIYNYVNNNGWNAKAYLRMASCQEITTNHESAAHYYQKGSKIYVDRQDIDIRNLHEKARQHRGMFPQYYNQEGLENLLPTDPSQQAPRMKIPSNILPQTTYSSVHPHAEYPQPAPTSSYSVSQQFTMFYSTVSEPINNTVHAQNVANNPHHLFSHASNRSDQHSPYNPNNPYRC